MENPTDAGQTGRAGLEKGPDSANKLGQVCIGPHPTILAADSMTIVKGLMIFHGQAEKCRLHVASASTGRSGTVGHKTGHKSSARFICKASPLTLPFKKMATQFDIWPLKSRRVRLRFCAASETNPVTPNLNKRGGISSESS
jgi:hypothetical protein